MNWNQFKDNLQDFKSAIMEQWDWFIDEQLEVIEANQNYFVKKPQKAYVINNEEAEKRLADWQQQQRDKIR
ncbi:MAG: hypothetical protein ABL903_06430 [Methylococcales bacterium]